MERRIDWSRIPLAYEAYRAALGRGEPPQEAIGLAVQAYLDAEDDPQMGLPLRGVHGNG